MSNSVIQPESTDNFDYFDQMSLGVKNGERLQLLTTLAEFVSLLEKRGVDGPRHLSQPNLDARGVCVGSGAQFDVFIDNRGARRDVVMKRVHRELIDQDSTAISNDQQLRSHLRTLQVEIISLCRPSIQKHRNIVDLVAWGYDYPTSDLTMLLPVLIMERATCSLHEILCGKRDFSQGSLSVEVRHHLCLDVAEGLSCIHSCNIIHGDVKPQNVLVFEQDEPKVPYIGKLSDFGLCVALEEPQSVSFKSYLGTEGWKPPEASCYQAEVHGEFSPELLYKSDSFSYGLLVLSVLITTGQLPFDNSQLHEYAQPYERAIELIQGGDHQDLPLSLQARLEELCRAVLKLRTRDRADISSQLLADRSQSYTNWYDHFFLLLL